MKDIKAIVNESVRTWSKHARGRLEEEEINAVLEHVRTRLDELNPVISLYGAYNAGKSTLVNALLGREAAATGPVPETTRVTEYRWNGWTVCDTPGIDAPVEHERITGEQLRKSECVLFVVSSEGDPDNRMIYEEMTALLERGKQVLLVVNDKSGLLADDGLDRMTAVFRRMNANFAQVCRERGLGLAMPERLVVNARSAMKARLSEAGGAPKPVLLRQSRLSELEERVEALMRGRGEQDVVNALVDYLQPPFDRLEARLAAEMEDPAARKTEEGRTKLANERRRLTVEAGKLLRLRLNGLCVRLNQVDIDDAAAVRELIDAGLEAMSDDLQKMLAGRFATISRQFEEQYYQPTIRLPGDGVVQQPERPDPSIVDDMATELGTIMNGAREEITETIAASLKKLAEQLAEKIGKGLGEKIGRIILRHADKLAGALAALVIAGVELYGAHRRQQRYEQERRARAEALENMAARLRNDVFDAAMHEMETACEEFFGNLLQLLDNRDRQAAAARAGVTAALAELRGARDRLGTLISLSRPAATPERPDHGQPLRQPEATIATPIATGGYPCR